MPDCYCLRTATGSESKYRSMWFMGLVLVLGWLQRAVVAFRQLVQSSLARIVVDSANAMFRVTAAPNKKIMEM